MVKKDRDAINLYNGKPVSRQANNFKQSVGKISYSSESFKVPKTVVRGTWRGYKFSIQDTGPFPTAYVAIPKGHPLYGKHPKDPAFDALTVHGGIYSAGGVIPRGHSSTRSDRWWIGWQYAELDDYLGFYAAPSSSVEVSGKKWTEEEILEQIRSVIEQLAKTN